MSAPVVARKCCRFGPFELDIDNGELRKGGARLQLQDQPRKILGILLENAGRIVTRDELRAAIWPADTYVDFDHSLNTAIRKLRSALDDSADAPRYVETAARHGYRFVAHVEWADGTDPSAVMNCPPAAAGIAPDNGLPPTPEESTIRWRLWAAIALLGIVVIGVTSRYAGRSRESIAAPSPGPPAAASPVRTIAVLPIANANAKTEHVSDGLTRSLIDELSTSPSLRVTAPTSSFRYKGSSATAPTIGRELGVSTILTGSLEEESRDYHLRIELVDTRDGAEVWAMELVYPADNVETLRSRLLRDTALRLGISHADHGVHSPSPEAYDLYLRGRFLWDFRTRSNLLRAVELFEQAIAIDPEFAQAWSGLGNTYGVIVGNALIPGSEEELERKAEFAITRALALDGTLAEAWASRAAGKLSYHFDFQGSERDFKRAIQLNPSYASAHQWYSALLQNTGRSAEARREIDLAYQLDPFSVPVNSFVCWNRLLDRRYDEAIAHALRAQKADPRMHLRNCIMWCQLLQGDYDKAIETMRAYFSPTMADALDAALKAGSPPAFWRERAAKFPNDPYHRAVSYAFAGDRDQAFAELDEAYATHSSNIGMMYIDPRLDALRPDPRFEALALKIGFPQAKQRAASK